jgi:urease accessory protein
MDAGPAAFAELPLLVWLSPAFPVGGFAYSHGLEAVVEAGLVTDVGSLCGWISDLLAHGSIRQDAILLAAAWRAAGSGDRMALAEVNDLALALCPARERRLETSAMGNAFATTLRATWPGTNFATLDGPDLAYPVAVGMASAGQGLRLEATLAAFGLAFVANLVSAAVRLGPIGQTHGQRVTAGLIMPVCSMAAAAAATTLDDLGTCAFRSDLAALHHETQYSRLFRS